MISKGDEVLARDKEESITIYTRASRGLAMKFRRVKEKLGLESNSEVVRHLISRVYEDMFQPSAETKEE